MQATLGAVHATPWRVPRCGACGSIRDDLLDQGGAVLALCARPATVPLRPKRCDICSAIHDGVDCDTCGTRQGLQCGLAFCASCNADTILVLTATGETMCVDCETVINPLIQLTATDLEELPF